MVVQSEAGRDDRRLRATARRLRLYARVPDRPHVCRRPRPEDLWRHQRDHEIADRPLIVSMRGQCHREEPMATKRSRSARLLRYARNDKTTRSEIGFWQRTARLADRQWWRHCIIRRGPTPFEKRQHGAGEIGYPLD